MIKTELKSIRQLLQDQKAVLREGQNTEGSHQLDSALRRIAKGTYGICVDCGEEIAPLHLAAQPWLAYCLTCQEATSAERKQPVRWFDHSMFYAA